MAQAGRKPLAAGHVEHLSGSSHARRRLQLILECMQGQKTVYQACEELGICESRFHAMRNQWLQEALELLEPRQPGRPPKASSADPLQQQLARLEAENAQLREELRVAQVRVELAQIEATAQQQPLKKNLAPARGRSCAPR